MNTDVLRGEIAATYRTQANFAGKIGWNCNKVSRLLNGSYKPNTDEIAKIASVLGLSEKQFCNIFLPCNH